MDHIYYLPGYGGALNRGLGAALISRGYVLSGRELCKEFKALQFQEQINLICDDLEENFWSSDSSLIANSFGAYLFLHAQAQLPPYPGRVLLLSPIVGDFAEEDRKMFFIPPRADKLKKLTEAGVMPVPRDCEIHVGSKDWQSIPSSVVYLGNLLGITVTVVPGVGHNLGKEYVGGVLDRWLLQKMEVEKLI